MSDPRCPFHGALWEMKFPADKPKDKADSYGYAMARLFNTVPLVLFSVALGLTHNYIFLLFIFFFMAFEVQFTLHKLVFRY